MRIGAIALAVTLVATAAKADDTAQQKALDFIKANTEDRFRSMSWDGPTTLFLMRHDIGMDQTAMAKHVCVLLQVNGYPDVESVWVGIYDMTGTKKLGSTFCRQSL